MLGRLKGFSERILAPICKSLAASKIPPSLLTVVGLAVSSIAAYLFAVRQPLAAAAFIMLMGLCDALDGGVARLTGKVSGFGATLDASIDRYTEFLQALGIALGGYVDWPLSMAVAFTMGASSYVRARAESTGGMKECSVGLIERPEKLLLLIAGAILTVWFNKSLEFVFWVILVLGQFTVLQRLSANWRHSRSISNR